MLINVSKVYIALIVYYFAYKIISYRIGIPINLGIEFYKPRYANKYLYFNLGIKLKSIATGAEPGANWTKNIEICENNIVDLSESLSLIGLAHH